MPAATETSSPAVGSSATNRSGPNASARRCPTPPAWPPESWCGYLSACSLASPTIASNSSTFCFGDATGISWMRNGSMRVSETFMRGLRLERDPGKSSACAPAWAERVLPRARDLLPVH